MSSMGESDSEDRHTTNAGIAFYQDFPGVRKLRGVAYRLLHGLEHGRHDRLARRVIASLRYDLHCRSVGA